MDELKKYLRDHEPFMEVEMPDEKSIWRRIAYAEGKKERQKSSVVLFMRYAAAACIIAVIILGLVQLTKNDTRPTRQPVTVTIKNKLPVGRDTSSNKLVPVVTVMTGRKKTKHVIKPEPVKAVENIRNSYAQLVNYQLKQLRKTPVYAEDPGYFTDFKMQLQQMDKDEASLRSDMKLYGLNDQLLDELINIYQQKLNLLKTLQGEIKKMNNKVKEKQPKDQSGPYYLNI